MQSIQRPLVTGTEGQLRGTKELGCKQRKEWRRAGGLAGRVRGRKVLTVHEVGGRIRGLGRLVGSQGSAG